MLEPNQVPLNVFLLLDLPLDEGEQAEEVVGWEHGADQADLGDRNAAVHLVNDLLFVHLEGHEQRHEIALLFDALDHVVDGDVLRDLDGQEALLTPVLALQRVDEQSLSRRTGELRSIWREEHLLHSNRQLRPPLHYLRVVGLLCSGHALLGLLPHVPGVLFQVGVDLDFVLCHTVLEVL